LFPESRAYSRCTNRAAAEHLQMRGISGLFTTWGVVGDRNAPGRPSGIGAGSMLAAARDAGWVVGDDVGVEYVSRGPGPPLDGLIDALYYLGGARPSSRLA